MIAFGPSLPSAPTAADFRFTPPGFAPRAIREILKTAYGIGGDLDALAGERDQNVRVSTRDGRQFVLKISCPQETAEAVDFQTDALEHVRQTDSQIGVPRVVPTRDGALRSSVADARGVAHHVRLLTYVPGVPIANVAAPTAETLRAVGALIGRLVRALAGVAPPPRPEFLPWDVMNGLVVMDGFRERYLPEEYKGLCLPFLDRFEAETLPRLHGLPAQVIHNDLHPGNVLCAPDDPTRLTGCIDFGDIVVRPTVMELSSALAEFAGIVPDVAAGAQAMLSGYRSEAPFADDLLPLLYDATLARAILSVQLAMFRLAHSNLDPAIETVHLPGAIAAVRAIASIDRDDFAAALAATP